MNGGDKMGHAWERLVFGLEIRCSGVVPDFRLANSSLELGVPVFV